MTIKLVISKSRLTIGDIIKAEGGFQSTTAMVDFLSRFVSDGNGGYLSKEAALAALMDCPVEDLPDLTRQVVEGVNAVSEAVVPLANDAP